MPTEAGSRCRRECRPSRPLLRCCDHHARGTILAASSVHRCTGIDTIASASRGCVFVAVLSDSPHEPHGGTGDFYYKHSASVTNRSTRRRTAMRYIVYTTAVAIAAASFQFPIEDGGGGVAMVLTGQNEKKNLKKYPLASFARKYLLAFHRITVPLLFSLRLFFDLNIHFFSYYHNTLFTG